MDPVEEMLERVRVDAYGDGEQLTSFEALFGDEGRFPFPATVVGAPVDVIAVEFDGDERRGLVAVCRRAGAMHRVSLLDVEPAGPLTVTTRLLLEAHRRWACAPPLTPTETAAPQPWAYRSLVAAPADDLGQPLGLRDEGLWDPAEEWWGDDPDRVTADPVLSVVIAAGRRRMFEMEQVLPGVAIDDIDDPIIDAVDLHRAGLAREANRLLRGMIDRDVRCVDAWVHLGNFTLDNHGPGRARPLYETAVAISERALHDGFGGVLPRGLVDNRPFLRALHGLALCAWRQRRWSEAEEILTTTVWLDPASAMTPLALRADVQARTPWRDG